MDPTFMKDIPFFEFLPSGDRPRMAQFLDLCRYGPGDVLFNEGDDPTGIGFLIRGQIMVFKEIDGERKPLNTIRSPNLFGEMALIDNSKRKAGLVVVDEALVASMSSERFEQLTGQHPRLAVLMLRSLAKILVQRIEQMNEKIAATAAP